MMPISWQNAKKVGIWFALISGICWGIFWILTPILGKITPFSGIKWTIIGILWIISTLWEYSLLT